MKTLLDSRPTPNDTENVREIVLSIVPPDIFPAESISNLTIEEIVKLMAQTLTYLEFDRSRLAADKVWLKDLMNNKDDIIRVLINAKAEYIDEIDKLNLKICELEDKLLGQQSTTSGP